MDVVIKFDNWQDEPAEYDTALFHTLKLVVVYEHGTRVPQLRAAKLARAAAIARSFYWQSVRVCHPRAGSIIGNVQLDEMFDLSLPREYTLLLIGRDGLVRCEAKIDLRVKKQEEAVAR